MGCFWGTDDTASVQAAIDAATDYGLMHGAANVNFDDGIYIIAGAPGGVDMLAQLRLPAIDAQTTDRKVHLIFTGAFPSTGLMHWHEPHPPSSGTVLFSMYWNNNEVPVAPPPVVLGGPVMGYGGNGGKFSNLRVVVDGINILAAHRSCISGLDLFGVSQADIKSFSYFTCAKPEFARGASWPVLSNAGTNPSAWQTFGYRSPTVGNNGQNDTGRITVYSAYHGVIIADHYSAKDVTVLAAAFGVTCAASDQAHTCYIDSLMVELTTTVLHCDDSGTYSGGGRQPIHISSVHAENATTLVRDNGNNLRGSMNIEQLGLYPPIAGIVGAENFRILYDEVPLGPVSSWGVNPDVPATDTAFKNPYWRDAIVVVSGGSVTQIRVNGVDQGVTSGPVLVPTGGKITLTHTTAPTWAWSLL